ncbi:sugar ABC transporter permease [Paenibacillus pectinilyticus]|uniref:Sugar ABC transporter permease n=1 Tax=Paenibacillus pectinilyticus TaxID=512399 RepID=A0A1C1A4L6_9BACL|nr:carbohydrate ABC transporter permease [Paenibacillus pectinilyticus]OCT15499.1 sugar ABC transporter permease [Paenibacillus pectinilyticus]
MPQHLGKNMLFKSFLWLYGIVSLYPILYMLFYSLKNNDEIFFSNPLGIPLHFRFENYTKAVSAFNVVELFKNSVIVSVISIAFILILSLGFAYATARITWRFRGVAYTYLMLGLFIPVQVIMIPLAILVKDIGFANTYFSLIVPYTAFNLAFSTLIFYGFFRTIPVEIEESAYMDGASIYRTFAQIIVPLVKPSIATVTIFAFLNIWNEYPMALILVTNAHLKTLPTGLISFVGQFSTDWGAMGAAMVLSSLPTILVYLLLSEQVEKALTVGSAVKG